MEPMSSEVQERRWREIEAVPSEPERTLSPWQRFVRSPWTWITLGMTLVFAGCLWDMYAMVHPDQEVPGGVQYGINHDALWLATKYALPTVIFWIIVFGSLGKQYNPLGWWRGHLVRYLALGWGACVSTWLSIYANTWAAAHLAIRGDGDPASGPRAAIYVAPFVEESTKASVLFLIAILVSYRIVNKIGGIALAGLSAAGFAFTENIIYYGRVAVMAQHVPGVGTPTEVVQQLAMLRGLLLAFGHPLFTMMTGIGIVVGLRHRSRIVRVLAPLVGFLSAAMLHMIFNTMASGGGGEGSQKMMYFIALATIVLPATIYTLTQLLMTGRVVRNRLTDYVRMGWLRDYDPVQFGKLRHRWRQLILALSYGWSAFTATWRMQRAMTEIAYLRDSMVRGIVDYQALGRERELLHTIRDLRGIAVDNTAGRKIRIPFRRPKPVDAGWAPPSHPGPGGVGGYYPAP